jgi:D-beta-D-heptose 7-phosphate kinase/D-beta-D-heptose 1-phosphate adenosyltransferase
MDGQCNPTATEVTIMAELACVDYVVVFQEDTPLKLIKLMRPAVLVKGNDYQPECMWAQPR